jgi:hypothetical protein
VHPDHDRGLVRRVDACRRTPARRQPWWARLAAEGQSDPSAAVLAVITAGRARERAEADRRAARAVARDRRERARADRAGRRAAAVAAGPRSVPLKKSASSTRRTWVLVVTESALLMFVWLNALLGAETLAYFTGEARTSGAQDAIDTYRDAAGAVWLAVVLLGVLPAMHAATSRLFVRGASRRMIRAYAAAAAVVDLLLGVTLLQAAALGLLVLRAGVETRAGAVVSDEPFGAGRPWAAAALLAPFAVVGPLLALRSIWRLGRAAFGGHVAGPGTPPPPPPWPTAGLAVPPPLTSARRA